MRWKQRCLHETTRSHGWRSGVWVGALVLTSAAVIIIAASVMRGEAAPPATGACCTRASVDPLTWSCQQVTARECDELCGVYHGDKSKCQQVDCTAGPVRTCVDRATRVEIAGDRLSGKPFFTHSVAFRSDSEVWGSIDPARFPELAGRTCHVYLVAARDEAEWLVNDALIDSDVRSTCPGTDPGTEATVCPGDSPPCPCTIRFPSEGATLEDYEFQLAASGQLAGVAEGAEPCLQMGLADQVCVGVGAGLDVILDCNQDGLVGAGDYVDGLGPAAGLYVTHNTAHSRLVTDTVFNNVAVPGWQQIYYPREFRRLDPLPLVVISHGVGHRYTMYDYIGRHLASYGYLVMSHENDPILPESAARMTLRHTDALLALLATSSCPPGVPSALCDLAGHVDDNRIVWIGHSRGGEGVVRAYDRLYGCAPEYDPGAPDCDFTGEGPDALPTHFRADDIALLVGLAPTNILAGSSDPHDVPYALIYGAADADVTGSPQVIQNWPFRIFERAIGRRQSLYVHGMEHEFLRDCSAPSEDCNAPLSCMPGALSAGDTRTIVRAYLVPLLDHYVRGGRPALDYLWRPWDRFLPTSVSATTALDYRNGLDPAGLVIDDFQDGDPLRSSEGYAVFGDVDRSEGPLWDGDCTFEWDPDLSNHVCEPDESAIPEMNGMTRAAAGDDARGVALGWRLPGQYGYDFLPAGRDFSGYVYLSFRAAQITRDPDNSGDNDFSIALEDADERRVSLSTSSYQSSINLPYQRAESCGWGRVDPADPGIGWQNEFETVRIPLRDFQANGSVLDLSHIVRLSFEFGNPGDSPAGRVAIDDVELTSETYRPQPQPCPRVQPCDTGCEQQGEPLGLLDHGVAACRLESGELLECAEGTVHVASYGCARAACCTSTPACICPANCAPSGTFLECRTAAPSE